MPTSMYSGHLVEKTQLFLPTVVCGISPVETIRFLPVFRILLYFYFLVSKCHDQMLLCSIHHRHHRHHHHHHFYCAHYKKNARASHYCPRLEQQQNHKNKNGKRKKIKARRHCTQRLRAASMELELRDDVVHQSLYTV